MATKGPSPLLGYNTNVRHKGKLYHIQTEDSGINHPHIITHLFADGGRIIASRKTSYAEHVGTEGFPGIVKKLMQEQHKAMFIALRDGVYDEDGVVAPTGEHKAIPEPGADVNDTLPGSQPAEAIAAATAPSAAPVDIDAFERAAAARLSAGPTPAPKTSSRPPSSPARKDSTGKVSLPPGAGRYSTTRPAKAVTRVAPKSQRPTESIFGNDLLSEKSLDEVILSYLAEDLDEEDR